MDTSGCRFRVAGRAVESVYASGDGGQFIFIFPAFEMVVVFTGGNYASALADQPHEIVTQFLIPAVQ